VRLLADESCDFALVRGLRAAGYDVTAVVEECRGADDEIVVALAKTQNRILLTEDKDFGQLVFAAAKEASGVIFVRFPQAHRDQLVPAILKLLAVRGDSLYGMFAVVEPGRVRLIRLP